jgi:hypothetical protein
VEAVEPSLELPLEAEVLAVEVLAVLAIIMELLELLTLVAVVVALEIKLLQGAMELTEVQVL